MISGCYPLYFRCDVITEAAMSFVRQRCYGSWRDLRIRHGIGEVGFYSAPGLPEGRRYCKRTAQRRLAAEVTSLVHGDDGLERAVCASEVLFGREISNLSDAELSEVFVGVPSLILDRSLLETGIRLTDLLVQARACSSKSEAVRLVRGGGVYLNNGRVESAEITLRAEHLASESMLILRLGKKSFHVARFE
jgi:tyrosyl-tRNA synthetase